MQALEPRMHAIAGELVAAALERREVDLVEALTYPLPVIVIAEILGVPPEDRDRFKPWSDVAVEGLGNGLFVPPTRERLQRLNAVREEMDAYFSVLADERRRRPREDLLTGLVQAELEGSHLTHAEMLRMLILLLAAGNETTTNLIGNAVLALLDHPEELAKVRTERANVSALIEEVLRYDSPVQVVYRQTSQEIELEGGKLPAGATVLLLLGAAN